MRGYSGVLEGRAVRSLGWRWARGRRSNRSRVGACVDIALLYCRRCRCVGGEVVLGTDCLKLCGAVRCGAVRCGAVRCGAVRCGAVRCGAVLCLSVPCCLL